MRGLAKGILKDLFSQGSLDWTLEIPNLAGHQTGRHGLLCDLMLDSILLHGRWEAVVFNLLMLILLLIYEFKRHVGLNLFKLAALVRWYHGWLFEIIAAGHHSLILLPFAKPPSFVQLLMNMPLVLRILKDQVSLIDVLIYTLFFLERRGLETLVLLLSLDQFTCHTAFWMTLMLLLKSLMSSWTVSGCCCIARKWIWEFAWLWSLVILHILLIAAFVRCIWGELLHRLTRG